MGMRRDCGKVGNNSGVITRAQSPFHATRLVITGITKSAPCRNQIGCQQVRSSTCVT